MNPIPTGDKATDDVIEGMYDSQGQSQDTVTPTAEANKPSQGSGGKPVVKGTIGWVTIPRKPR